MTTDSMTMESDATLFLGEAWGSVPKNLHGEDLRRRGEDRRS